MTDHTFAAAITSSYKVHDRKPADYYPSPPDVTHALMQHLCLPRHTIVWEPACGDGSMSKVIEQYVDRVLSSDLRTDTGYGNQGVDFLLQKLLKVDFVITNPPFSHAAEFIERARETTPNVAMLLKSTFWHAKKRYKLFHDHPPTQILPLTWRPAFLEKERGKSPLMDVMWVVWSENRTRTDYMPLLRPSTAKDETRSLEDLLLT